MTAGQAMARLDRVRGLGMAPFGGGLKSGALYIAWGGESLGYVSLVLEEVCFFAAAAEALGWTRLECEALAAWLGRLLGLPELEVKFA